MSFMRNKRSVFTLPGLCAMGLVVWLHGCASMQQMNTCNQLAYRQAPPVYDQRMQWQLQRCQMGVWMHRPGSLDPTFPGVMHDPFFNPMWCDQIKQSADLNFDARRAIFETCMKNPDVTVLPPVQPVQSGSP
jgi:hypothetical protein